MFSGKRKSFPSSSKAEWVSLKDGGLKRGKKRSNAHGTFSKIDYMIGHKTSLNKFKKIDITSRIFSDYRA